MINDLLGGDPIPVAASRRIVQHQPAVNPIFTFPTLGDAERPAAVPGPGSISTPAPFVQGSVTSRRAARALSNAKLVGKREALLRVICQRYPLGFTDNQLIRCMVDEYNWSPNTPRARRVELSAFDAWVRQQGERDGSAVWVPTEAALEWYRTNP